MKAYPAHLGLVLVFGLAVAACTDASSTTTMAIDVAASGGGVAIVPAEESLAGLTVSVTGRTSVPADEVFVIVVPQPNDFGPFPQGLTSDDRTQIKAGMQTIGIPDDDTDFPPGQIYSPFGSVVRVKVDPTELPEIGDQVLEVIEDVAGRSVASGLQFGVTDCNAAFRQAWTDAVETAEVRASALAASASTELGPIIAVSEGAVSNLFFGAPIADPCDTESVNEFQFETGFAPFDSDLTVEIEADLDVTYAFTDTVTTVPGITVVSKGLVRSEADEAYVVVAFESFGEFGAEQISAEDRSAVFDALSVLGYGEDDVEVENQPFSDLQVIQVELPASELVDAGDAIVDAVEDVMGRSALSGATFAHSNCEELLAKARNEAVNGGVARANVLASVAGVSLGGVQAIREVDVLSSFSPLPVDPCDEDAPFDIYSVGLAPFEAEPKIVLRSAVQVTMAISS